MVKISVETCQELIGYLQSCEDAHAEGLAEELQTALAKSTYEDLKTEEKLPDNRTKGGAYII